MLIRIPPTAQVIGFHSAPAFGMGGYQNGFGGLGFGGADIGPPPSDSERADTEGNEPGSSLFSGIGAKLLVRFGMRQKVTSNLSNARWFSGSRERVCVGMLTNRLPARTNLTHISRKRPAGRRGRVSARMAKVCLCPRDSLALRIGESRQLGVAVLCGGCSLVNEARPRDPVQAEEMER